MQEAEDNCSSVAELTDLLGRARAKRGMFEGDLNEGELEIGQISALLKDITPAGQIVEQVWNEFCETTANPFSY